MSVILKDTNQGIATLTINRPDKLNALNAEVFALLKDYLAELKNDPDLRGVIITGAGDKAFVAGADIKELSSASPEDLAALSAKGQAQFDVIADFPVPVMAAINGFALGGGCELALACHFRYASENAKLGLPEVSLGLIPGYGGTQRLARTVGLGQAIEMVASGQMIDAQRALQCSLINRVLAAEELLPAAEKTMQKIAAQSPCAVRTALSVTIDGLAGSLAEGQKRESQAFGECGRTEDMKEGTQAFLEKRKAEFKGK